MKNKFIILTLCFCIIFSSCTSSFASEIVQLDSNIDVSEIEPYILPGVALAPELIALIGTVAVGSGIYLKNKDDLYDVARLVYEKNASNWDNVLDAFSKCAVVSPGNLVKVGSKFLEFCKSAFDEFFSTSEGDVYISGVPIGKPFTILSGGDPLTFTVDSDLSYAGISRTLTSIRFVNASNRGYCYLYDGTYNYKTLYSTVEGADKTFVFTSGPGSFFSLYCNNVLISDNFVVNAPSVPYEGTYNWNGVQEKVNEEDGSISIGVPGNASDLIGDNVDVFNPTYGLTNGTVALPDVVDPSISVGDSVALPVEEGVAGEGSATDEGVWGKVKDFVISLVVPSDLFWTEAFEGVYSEFNKSFPMVNLDNFKLLAVGGKPFPNIYVTVLGSKCKIVDGDVINSIVDWLKPLIAGFMMLCLMFFNYRKIYKLIRNTEPFGNIAPGTSDFSTGMSAPSEYSAHDRVRDQLRDVMFDMRNEMLSRKYGGKD